MQLYAVCNDYSLALSKDKPDKGYVWKSEELCINGTIIAVELGYHKEYRELHYLRTAHEENLEGKSL